MEFRELLRRCPDPIWILGGNLVVYANAAALRLFRAATEAEIIGVHWHRLVSPECWDAAEAHCAIPDAEAGAQHARLEINYLALDGSGFAADSTSAPVRVDGRAAVMLVAHEITARKRIEQELREQHTRLEQLVLERTADLRQALADARLSDRAKDAFLANVSHELRTPLGGMLGMLELTLGRCKDASLRDPLEKIFRAGKHLSRIIDDLLDLSKVVAGRMELEAIPFSLREMLLHAQEVVAHKAEAKGLQLRFRADNEIPDALLGDPMRIEQILLNLVGNAIKFTPSGRVDMHISLATRSEDQVRVQIDVEDTGIGMTAEEISGLFQPFTQATAATSREYGGTGLGLALSQRLAEAMGGRITVRSRKGQGSVFSFGLRLPLAVSVQAAIPAPGPAAIHADRSHARVLLVEDDPLNVEIVTELLQAVGIYPQLAENGHEAAAILSQEGPAAYDLVLMDVQMPVLDGHAATRLVRSWPGFAALPIIAMTAHVLERERHASLTAGMNDLISKPFDTVAFHDMLDKWLPWGARSATPAATPAPTPPPSSTPSALPSLRCLDVAAAVERFAGNEARYRHWLGKFVDDSPLVAPELRSALAAGENEHAANLVHSFKGSVGTLGLVALHARAAELEAAIRGGHGAVPELRQLERAIDEARREIISALGL
ncbi:MAG: response regulator [Rhodocyclales bacterium]|nr:response regulator [Rhodocyclales bacterium]